MDFMELDKFCNIEIDGKLEHGKQFDLDITLPHDERNVIYGIVKDNYGNYIENAVVKLVEITKDERRPISHTFTDKHGEFLFGPLCPARNYAVEIWVNRVDHIKICKTCHHKGECLKGMKLECNECRPHFDKDKEKENNKDYDKDYEKDKKDKEHEKYDNYDIIEA